MISINGAQHLVRCLLNHGVNRIYGVPGEETEDLQFAIDESDIEFVICRHEQAAAFMADAEGRLTGRPGVCLSTLGPGATNLLTGLVSANQDHSPMIVITAQADQSRQHQHSHQLIDVISLFRPVVKWSHSLDSADQITETIAKAFKIAMSSKPGVCHIEISENIAAEIINPQKVIKAEEPMISGLMPQDVKLIVNKLKSAKRPLILAGAGVNRHNANEPLLHLAKKLNVPVLTTFMGKGSIPDNEDVSLRSIGLGITDYPVLATSQADVLLSIGVDLAEYHPKGLQLADDVYIIHMHEQPCDIYKEYIPNIEFVTDICSSLNALEDATDSAQASSNWYKSIRDKIIDNIENYHQADNADVITVPGIIGAIESVMPAEGILVSDVGAHKMWIARNYATQSRNGCLISNNFASMGFALPVSVAAAINKPDRPIIAMIGDGGFMMNCQTLETAVRYNVGITIILMVDQDYGLISWKQERSKGESNGTTFQNPDFEKLASSFGAEVHAPKSIGDLKKTLLKTLNNKKVDMVILPISDHVNDTLTNIEIK